MTKTKVFSAALSLMLACAPLALAAEDYLPDVENVVAEAVPGGATLSWDAVEGADLYTIYFDILSVSQDGGEYASQILVEGATTHTFSDLTPETTYYFAIAADDSTGTYLGSYNYSEEVMVTTGAGVAAPAALEAVPGAETDLTPPADLVADILETPTEPEASEPAAEENLLPAATVEETPVTTSVESTPTTEHSAAENQSQTLPQSGPFATSFLLVSAAGAYFWRKRKA